MRSRAGFGTCPLCQQRVGARVGAAQTCGSGACEDIVTDLSAGAPHNYQFTSLTAGRSYYARVSAHNSQGFGYPVLTTPEMQVPTFRPPGGTPPVRMVSSSSTASTGEITVEWDAPRENGDAKIMGYQLWVG